MKKLLLPLILAAVLLAGCGQPSNIDNATYGLGNDALDACHDYQNGKLTREELRAKLDDVSARLDELVLDDSKSSANMSVKIDISMISSDLTMLDLYSLTDGIDVDVEMPDIDSDIAELEYFLKNGTRKE